MQRIKNPFAKLSLKTIQLLIIIGLITLGLLIFSLASIRDLMAPASINDFIINPIPLVLSILGIIAIYLVLKDKTRPASYLFIIGMVIGLFLISVITAQATYSTIAEILIVIIPVVIAIQALSEGEFTWIVIITLVARSVIQILGTSKLTSPISGASGQTEVLVQWGSALIAFLFVIYIALNLNNFPFRTKMILVLGVLVIVPTTILANISKQDLQTNLIGQANQSLVLSSDQLASNVDSFIQTTLDTIRTDSQIPTLENYLDQPGNGANSGGRLLPRGTDLELAANDTLAALLKKDPLNIISCNILDSYGTVQLSTSQAEIGKFEVNQDYYIQPHDTGLPFMSPVSFTLTGTAVVHFSAPVRSPLGITNGILDITYSASIFQQLIVRSSDKLGTGVATMLLDNNGIILAHSSEPNFVFKIVNPPDTNSVYNLIYTNRLQNLDPKQLTVQIGGLSAGLKNISNVQYFSGNFNTQISQGAKGSSLPDQAGASELRSNNNWYIVTYVPQSTLLVPVQKQTQSVVIISILITLLGIAIALGLTQVLVSPIQSLTRTSEQITQGDISATAKVRTHDEIGILAVTFNAMTARVRDLVGGLEQRVAERTKALERRAVQLQAAGDVGSTVARLRNLDELLGQVTRLISQRFGYYHVGIFLIDELGEYAILRASNSEGGQRMLAREHKLKVGETGIVGHVAATGQARIALNVGQDAEYFKNPDLPLTQSEMALPLIVSGKILGALDIQSTEPGAFTDDDISTLKVLADQIAVAIENARLFSENQAALETARRAYGEMSLKGWQQKIQESRVDIGYMCFAEDKVIPVSGAASIDFQQALLSGKAFLSDDGAVLHLPIKIRGQSIGAIRMDKHQDGNRWTSEDVSMANSLAEQLGTALESARLYSDISQRAERESIISEIASKIGASIQIDTILRTSVEELGRALKDSEVTIQVGNQSTRGDGNE